MSADISHNLESNMLRCGVFAGLVATAIFFSGASHAESQCGKTSDFNSCILEAVDLIHQSREHGGYAEAYPVDSGSARCSV